MNATLVNTAPHPHHHGNNSAPTGDDSSSARLPLTPRRRLQIPSVFETGGVTTLGKSSPSSNKLINSPGKLKIPSAFSVLKSSLQPPCIDHGVDATAVTNVPSPVVETVGSPRSRTKVGQLQDTVNTFNAAPSSSSADVTAIPAIDPVDNNNSTTASLKTKRKIRKKHSTKLSAKQQLLMEIAALQKEIEEASLPSKAVPARSGTVVATPDEAPAEAGETALLPLPTSDDSTLDVIDMANNVSAEVEAAEIERSDDAEDLILLEESSESNATDDAVVVGVRGDDLKSWLGEASPAVATNEVNETQSESVVPTLVIDSGSIQSPRAKMKTSAKLRSFFRRRKSKKGKTSGLSS